MRVEEHFGRVLIVLGGELVTVSVILLNYWCLEVGGDDGDDRSVSW